LTAQDVEQDRPADTDATGRDEPTAQRAAAPKAREQGLRRYRPGPGHLPAARVSADTSVVPEPRLDNEIQSVERALNEHGPTERTELARMVGARYWGPGMFRAALRKALAEGGVRRISRTSYAASDRDDVRAGKDVAG
jgi:hypothetical protein